MIILGIDSASISACCGISDNNQMIADGFANNGLTHSQTLLPLINSTCQKADIKIKDVDLICITKGPGSFTGLRIGMATVKGMAAPFNTKCIGVSTLEAIATTARNYNGIICAVMDARCHQVYNALFKSQNGVLVRLCDDRAIMIDDLNAELKQYKEQIILSGDGSELCLEHFSNINVKLADEKDLLPKGESLCFLGEKYKNEAIESGQLTPVYLRLPQAQRELLKKKKEVKK